MQPPTLEPLAKDLLRTPAWGAFLDRATADLSRDLLSCTAWLLSGPRSCLSGSRFRSFYAGAVQGWVSHECMGLVRRMSFPMGSFGAPTMKWTVWLVCCSAAWCNTAKAVGNVPKDASATVRLDCEAAQGGPGEDSSETLVNLHRRTSGSGLVTKTIDKHGRQRVATWLCRFAYGI